MLIFCNEMLQMAFGFTRKFSLESGIKFCQIVFRIRFFVFRKEFVGIKREI